MFCKPTDPEALGKRGGSHNKSFNLQYRALLPHAMEAILATVRDVVVKTFPDELKVPEHYNNAQRTATTAFLYPSTKYEYLSVKATFFADHVCWWIGSVPDAYIGRCMPTEEATEYLAIAANDILRAVED